MPQVIDGKAISAMIKEELKEEVARLKAEDIHICLAVIQVGNDPASAVYVGNKKKPVLISVLTLWLTNCRRRRRRKNCLS